jgi:hypothetical protein
VSLLLVRSIPRLASVSQPSRWEEVLRGSGIRGIPQLSPVLVTSAIPEVPDLPWPNAEALGVIATREVQTGYIESGDCRHADGGSHEKGVRGAWELNCDEYWRRHSEIPKTRRWSHHETELWLWSWQLEIANWKLVSIKNIFSQNLC